MPNKSRSKKPATQAPPNPNQNQRRNRKPRKSRLSRSVVLYDKGWFKNFLHPNLQVHYARPNHLATPYTVLREKLIHTGTTSNSVARIILAQPFSGISTDNLVPRFGCYGSGATPPGGAGEGIIASNLISPSVLGRVRMHRLAVTVSCTGTNAAGVTPDGLVTFGTLRTPVDRTAFASYDNFSAWIVNRQGLQTTSNYSLMTKPCEIVSYPIDPITYDEFRYVGGTPLVTDIAVDSLAPIVFCFYPTAATVAYAITFHVEWTIMYTGDSVLQATSTLHQTASSSRWEEAVSAALASAGVVEMAAGGAGIRGVQNLARNALPLI